MFLVWQKTSIAVQAYLRCQSFRLLLKKFCSFGLQWIFYSFSLGSESINSVIISCTTETCCLSGFMAL
jgi:hypothetical protein